MKKDILKYIIAIIFVGLLYLLVRLLRYVQISGMNVKIKKI